MGKRLGWIIMLAGGPPFAAGQLPPMPAGPDVDVMREPRLFVAEPVGTHDCLLTMKTGIERAQRLDIPVTIIVPELGK